MPVVLVADREYATAEAGGPSGYDPGKTIKGRKRHTAVDAEEMPFTIRVHPADAQDRNGAPDIIPVMPVKAPEVTRLRSDSGYTSRKLRLKLAEPGVPGVLEFVERPEGIKGFTVLCRRQSAERTFRADVAATAAGEGLRAELGEFRSLAACRLLTRRSARGASV